MRGSQPRASFERPPSSFSSSAPAARTQVLGCNPDALSRASAAQVRNAANVAFAFESVLGPVRRFLQGLPGWDEGEEAKP